VTGGHLDGLRGMSVVIPVRNAATTLDEQLTALAAADPPAGPVEIVVVDNGSTDASVEVALAHAGALRLRVVDASDRPGANHARNHGVLSSRHSRILMCDADDMVDRGWLTAMEGAFEAGHDLVGGPIDYMRLNPPEVRAWRGADKAPVGTVLGFLPAAHGANLGFTREVFDRISGFDDAFVYGGDDVEFCWRAQLAGSALHVATDAVVHYRLRASRRAVFAQARAYGSAEAALFRKFGPSGLRPRPLTAHLRDGWWLLSRMPFALSPGRRGAWLRRLGEQVGRTEGAMRHRGRWS
jgi:glycosyltransferase involved in cell wall biosynthesis